MRRKPREAVTEEEPKLDISSLIDVCFLLLIYFIVTSIIAPKEKDLPMTLPSGIHTTGSEEMTVFLGIREDGAILVNPGSHQEVLDVDMNDRSIPKVNERIGMMQSLAQAGGSNLLVQIAAHEGVKQQRFIDVLNCLRGNGLNTVVIADFE